MVFKPPFTKYNVSRSSSFLERRAQVNNKQSELLIKNLAVEKRVYPRQVDIPMWAHPLSTIPMGEL